MLLSARILPTLGLTIGLTMTFTSPATAQNFLTIDPGGNFTGSTAQLVINGVTYTGTTGTVPNNSAGCPCFGGNVEVAFRWTGSVITSGGVAPVTGIPVVAGMPSFVSGQPFTGGVFNAIQADSVSGIGFPLPITRENPGLFILPSSPSTLSNASTETSTLRPSASGDLNTPEATTEPGGVVADERQPESQTRSINSGSFLRPNGVHTRVFPFWSPGLYQ